MQQRAPGHETAPTCYIFSKKKKKMFMYLFIHYFGKNIHNVQEQVFQRFQLMESQTKHLTM